MLKMFSWVGFAVIALSNEATFGLVPQLVFGG
jgi:hypothetical protein